MQYNNHKIEMFLFETVLLYWNYMDYKKIKY